MIADLFDRWLLVFQSFGQHARELITSEVALKMLYILSEEQTLPKRNPVLLNRTLQNLIIKVILMIIYIFFINKSKDFMICYVKCSQVVPIENLNGRAKVEAGEICERRNGLNFLKLLILFCGLNRISYWFFWLFIFYFQEEELISIEIGVWIGGKKKRFVIKELGKC